MPLSLSDFKTQNPDYAEVPDQELADRLHQKFYSSMPKEDFYSKVGFKTAPKEEVKAPEDNVVQYDPKTGMPYTQKERNDSVSELTTGIETGVKQSPFWLGDLTKSVVQGVTRLGGAAYEKLGGELSPKAAEVLTNPTTPFSSSEIYEKAGAPLPEAKSSIGAMGNLLGQATGAGGFRSINDIRKVITSKLPKNGFLANQSSIPKPNTSPKPVEDFSALAEANKGTGILAKQTDPSAAGLNAIKGLNKQYDKNVTQAEKLYSAQKMLGEGETTSATDIAEPLSKTISDLEQSAVTSQQSSTLRRLKAIQEKYFTAKEVNETTEVPAGDNSKVNLFGNTAEVEPNNPYFNEAAGKVNPSKATPTPVFKVPKSSSGMSVAGETITPKAQQIELTDLVEIKQALNEGFRSNDFTKSSEIPLVKLNTIIKNKIESLDNSHPDFVQAGRAADSFYSKEVAAKFKDNSELQDLWQPEDHYAWKAAQKDPTNKGYTDATLTRAGKLLDNLNSGNEGRISAIINALPREEAIQVLHDAILHAKSVTPSLRNVALSLLGKSGAHGTVGTPIYSIEMALRNFIGAVVPSLGKEAPLLNLANRVTPKTISPYTAAGAAGLGYLGAKSFGTFNEEKKIPEKGAKNVQKTSDISPIGATNSALASSKKNDSFQLSDLNPISEAEASDIKVPLNSPISGNVAEFKAQDKGALQNAIKKHGANPTEIMTLINAESSVKKLTGNGYAQITPPAWKQAEQVAGRKLNRNNRDDYAEATVAYYKWTSDQVKKITGSAGQPPMKDVYPAYNAGVTGFKALHSASPNDLSVNVVPKEVSQNNKTFYFSKSGQPYTVKQTLKAYSDFVSSKMNEYSPTTTKGATKLALNKASVTNEPDQEPLNE